ncbi:restriction endonuclease subunit S [Chryseobacterium sp. HSC-36S06]|uniref:restriction endonuclease subunit S n=1 Tax=Chryseobacterium sp. HSC-36S06 TaxID=2910970 RepID=UPI00209C96A0|nr:restriction endonuclease subunit S [Chryseobacterium sp. HSC-36S06]MCP2036957.1 restriction endonuclease S subunit [Chryseobacterium sp. HSC-36S06]
MELIIDKSKWKKVRLGDVAFEYSKRINNPSESEFDRFVGSSNIGQWDFRVNSWESTQSVSSAMKLFEPNDYLLVRRSLYASDFRERAPRANFHGVCSGDILTIKENSEFVSDGFLIGIFNSQDLWNYVVANASGSITRRIKWRDLANYEFLLPPKEEQKKLAELLWAMDDVIEKEKRLLSNIEKLYFSKRKEIGKSGKSYKLKEIINLNYGKPLKNSDRINGEYDVISSAGFQGKHNLFISEGPGIVIGRKGNAGNVMWVENNFWTIDTAYYVSLSEKFTNIPMKGLYHILKNVDFKRDVTATAVPGLNREDALNRKVLIPENKELLSFVSDFEKLTDTENLILKKISFSQSLQKSLINQIF